MNTSNTLSVSSNTNSNNPWGVDEWNPGPWYKSFGSWPQSENEVGWLTTADELEAIWVLKTVIELHTTAITMHMNAVYQ